MAFIKGVTRWIIAAEIAAELTKIYPDMLETMDVVGLMWPCLFKVCEVLQLWQTGVVGLL